MSERTQVLHRVLRCVKRSVERALRTLCHSSRDGLRVFFEPRTLRESSIANEETKHLLLIGLSRTGTSLMQRLLNAYPTVFVTYESIYMPLLGSNSWQEIHAYYYEVLKQHKHLCLAQPDSAASAKPFSFEECYDYFGNKAMYHSGTWSRGRLSRAVVSQDIHKILFMLGDPQAWALSLRGWIRRRNVTYPRTARGQVAAEKLDERILSQSCEWNQYVADAAAHTRSSDKCKIVKYEDLVGSPRRVACRILEFLELDPARYATRILDTVDGRSVETWREELDPRIASQVAAITERYRQGFGYATDGGL